MQDISISTNKLENKLHWCGCYMDIGKCLQNSSKTYEVPHYCCGLTFKAIFLVKARAQQWDVNELMMMTQSRNKSHRFVHLLNL